MPVRVCALSLVVVGVLCGLYLSTWALEVLTVVVCLVLLCGLLTLYTPRATYADPSGGSTPAFLACMSGCFLVPLWGAWLLR